MKLSHPKIGLVLLGLVVSASGCGYINNIRAKSQLNEAVSAFKDKRYEEAEKYARKAIYLDPENENGPLILAVILQTEYRRGDPSEVNINRAEEAIRLYKDVAQKDPNNDQAFTTVTVLYGFLVQLADQQIAQAQKTLAEIEQKLAPPPPKTDAQGKPADQAKPAEQPKPEDPKELAKQKDALTEEINKWTGSQKKWSSDQIGWVEKRAENESVAKDKRAEAYAVLANKKGECARAVTDMNQERETQPDRSVTIKFKKPADTTEYDKALKCVAEGLALAATAISLEPNSETALAQKYYLLLEGAKLAKMDGNERMAVDYEKQATLAREEGIALHKKAKPAAPPPQPAG